jgi:CRP-like cAMP-binding protein
VLDYLRTEFIRDEILTRVYYAAQRATLTVPYQTLLLYQRSGAELVKADDFPQRLQQLSALAFFAAYPAPLVEQLARDAVFHQFGTEEWILPAGAFFRGFYIILEGEVRLVLRAPGEPATAPWREVDRLGAGEFFGELLLLRDQPSPYAIEVTQDLVTLFVQRTPFIEVAETNPRLAAAMNRQIEDREKLVRRAIGDSTAAQGETSSPLNGLVNYDKRTG